MTSFLFLLGSTREGGNTELLARRAADALPAHVARHFLRLDEHPLEPFVDIRHDVAAYPAPVGHAKTLVDATLAATDLVIAAPTYWYSLPAGVKSYLDHFSGWMRVPGLDFKASFAKKRLWVITTNSSAPGSGIGKSAPLVDTLRFTAEYLAMTFGGVLVGHGNRPGDVEDDAGAMREADRFFASVR